MKAAKWAPVAAALMLTACYSPPAPVRAPVQAAARIGTMQGVDIPNDASDVLNELKQSQFDFVARYYRHPTSRWPTLTPAEAQRLSSLGVNIVTVFESHSATPSYFSYAAGYNDAVTAYTQAKAVGQASGSAIYFAVDYNAPQSDIYGQVDRYFRGVRSGLIAAAGHAPEYRIGVYGSGAVCDYLKRARLAEFAWLSNATAWAGSSEFDDWDIRQTGRSASLSFSHDFNEARGEFGGFTVTSQYSAL